MNTPCSTDPDKWFTVLLPGAVSPTRNKKLVSDVKEAMLPAERMLRSGKNKEDYPVGTFQYAEYKMYEMVYNAVV